MFVVKIALASTAASQCPAFAVSLSFWRSFWHRAAFLLLSAAPAVPAGPALAPVPAPTPSHVPVEAFGGAP